MAAATTTTGPATAGHDQRVSSYEMELVARHQQRQAAEATAQATSGSSTGTGTGTSTLPIDMEEDITATSSNTGRSVSFVDQVESHLRMHADLHESAHLSDPDAARIDPVLMALDFTVQNGYYMTSPMPACVGVDIEDPISEQLLSWCPMARFYMAHRLEKSARITPTYIAQVRQGVVHSAELKAHALDPLRPLFEIMRLSFRDSSGILRAPVHTVWDLVRPARLAVYVSFLKRQYYHEPGTSLSSFSNKLTALTSLLDWVWNQDFAVVTRGERALTAATPPPQAAAAALTAPAPAPAAPNPVYDLLFCDTRTQLAQVAMWKQLITKQLTLMAGLKRKMAAQPQPQLREDDLADMSQVFRTTSHFKATHDAITARLDAIVASEFVHTDARRGWAFREDVDACPTSVDRLQTVAWEYQRLLVAVSALATQGCRKQVAFNMRSSNTRVIQPDGTFCLDIDFKEKTNNRQSTSLPILPTYGTYFVIYKEVVLPFWRYVIAPRARRDAGSDRFWRCRTTGAVMHPVAFSDVHMQVWHEYGNRVAANDTEKAPKRFGPLNVRRWVVTRFMGQQQTPESVRLLAQTLNTSTRMLEDHYDKARRFDEMLAQGKAVGELLFGGGSAPDGTQTAQKRPNHVVRSKGAGYA
eukprot:TRINITY_DN2781_c0_g1_i1.p1 TRINITY_DN2781_c0_g1~~TRINITY_DN2781_c0_g1_i1.p1  ORF type:complete len:681 (-),score=79.14 TRINITY_DN2781_c0_g1_i1:3154-5076(-)